MPIRHIRSPFLGFLATLLVAGTPSLVAQAPAKKLPLKPVAAQALAAPVRVTSVEGITEYRLGNGLRVLLFPDPGKPTVTVNVTYMVGSRHENYGETGMAHLLEHLLFKGTPKHPDVPKELTEHGTRPNGSTSFDRTNYFETMQSTETNLRWALELEADRMMNCFIAKKDLWDPEAKKGEMTVVRNEMESGENDPFSILMERVMATAFEWHSYGKTVIGARSDVENVNIERLQAFYHTYYQPDNATLLVAGKFDEAKTLALVNQIYGVIPKPSRMIQPTYTLDPTQDGERQVVVRRVGDVQVAMAAYHVPAGADPDFAAISVLSQILGDTPTGRLYKGLVEGKKATSAFAFPFQLKEPGLLLVGAQLRPDGNLDEAKELLLKGTEQAAAAPFTGEEVERAKQQILKQVDLALNTADRVGIALSEYIALGDWRMFFLDRDRVKGVTPADVLRVAQTYLKPTNRTLGLFVPTTATDRSEIPAMKDVAAMVKDYKGEAAKSAGEAFDTAPGAIEARSIRFTTPAGLKGVLVPKKTRGGSVSAFITLRLGDEKNLMGKSLSGDLAASMLMRGTTKHTRQQISDAFDRLKAQVNVFGGAESAMVMLETTRENLPEVLKLVTEILREPSFPEAEFEVLRQEELSGTEQQRTDPTAKAQLAYRRHQSPFAQGHPRYVDTLEERITALKAARLEDLKGFYQVFYGAGSGEVSLVGDFDAKEIQSLLGQLLGDWKSAQAYTRIPNQYKGTEALSAMLETPDKANAFFMAGLNLQVQDKDPEYPGLLLGNFMTGGGFLNSRLATRIRQKEGLSYGVGSMLNVGAQDKVGSWGAYAIYAPENAAKLETAFREELAKILKDGFTDEEIKAAKSGWLQSQQVSRAQDRELANRMMNNLFNGRTLAFNAELEKKVGDLTNEQILAALRKHLDPTKISIVKAGDFAKAKAVEKK